jgi:hypothetical protein
MVHEVVRDTNKKVGFRGGFPRPLWPRRRTRRYRVRIGVVVLTGGYRLDARCC